MLCSRVQERDRIGLDRGELRRSVVAEVRIVLAEQVDAEHAASARRAHARRATRPFAGSPGSPCRPRARGGPHRQRLVEARRTGSDLKVGLAADLVERWRRCCRRSSDSRVRPRSPPRRRARCRTRSAPFARGVLASVECSPCAASARVEMARAPTLPDASSARIASAGSAATRAIIRRDVTRSLRPHAEGRWHPRQRRCARP